MPTTPKKFLMMAMFLPWVAVRMWFSSGVFPLPRKPVSTVTCAAPSPDFPPPPILLNRGAREVFFTRNGAYLGGLALSRRDLADALYPAVGLDHADAVHANFGAEPFAYDLGAHEASHLCRAALSRALQGAPKTLLGSG